jgi:hypothetical protein
MGAQAMQCVISLMLAFAAQAATPTEATRVVVSPPTVVLELDVSKLGGDPYRLAWSPDGSELYLQVAKSDKAGVLKAKHFSVRREPGAALKAIEAEPAWAAKYWAWKANRSAPEQPTAQIEVESKQGIVRSTAAPMGGGLARGDPGGGATGGLGSTGTGASPEDVASSAQQSQSVTTYFLRFKGELVGEWVNQPVIPGLTFGWAPAKLGVLAFVNKNGRFLIMDVEGRKQEIPQLKDARLPAWSEDGSKLAFLAPVGKKKFNLTIADVSTR